MLIVRDISVGVMAISYIGCIVVGIVLFSLHNDINPCAKEFRKLRHVLYVFVSLAIVSAWVINSVNSPG